MPEIRHAGPEARSRLAKRSPADAELEPIRQAIRGLGRDQTLELVPDEGESMWKLKTLATRAANETGRAIRYGETHDGSLLVWLAEERRRPRRQADPANVVPQVQ